MIWALILCPNYRGRHFVSYMPEELLSLHRSPKRTIFSKWGICQSCIGQGNFNNTNGKRFGLSLFGISKF